MKAKWSQGIYFKHFYRILKIKSSHNNIFGSKFSVALTFNFKPMYKVHSYYRSLLRCSINSKKYWEHLSWQTKALMENYKTASITTWFTFSPIALFNKKAKKKTWEINTKRNRDNCQEYQKPEIKINRP